MHENHWRLLAAQLAAVGMELCDLTCLSTCAKPNHRTLLPGRQTTAIVPLGEHYSSSMHSRTAPIKPLTDITAVDVAPLAPMFASGSAYVSLAALLLVLLRQVSVAPLLLVMVVVTLPI